MHGSASLPILGPMGGVARGRAGRCAEGRRAATVLVFVAAPAVAVLAATQRSAAAFDHVWCSLLHSMPRLNGRGHSSSLSCQLAGGGGGVLSVRHRQGSHFAVCRCLCRCLSPVPVPASLPAAAPQVLLDLREECEKYGAVNDVVIPRPADAPKTAHALHGTGNFGKVGLGAVRGGYMLPSAVFAFCLLQQLCVWVGP
jgi:hypothetical protein